MLFYPLCLIVFTKDTPRLASVHFLADYMNVIGGFEKRHCAFTNADALVRRYEGFMCTNICVKIVNWKNIKEGKCLSFQLHGKYDV